MAGPNPGGNFTKLNIAATTVVSAVPGILTTFIVTTAGAVGAVYDNNSTTVGNTPANLIAVVPAAVGPVTVNWTCKVGITYVPGSLQAANFSFS